MKWAYRKNERQRINQTLQSVTTKERERVKRTTKQKVSG